MKSKCFNATRVNKSIDCFNAEGFVDFARERLKQGAVFVITVHVKLHDVL